LELGLLLSPIFIPLPSQIFLSSCWKILGHLVGFFIFLYGLKITRTVEKSSGSYLIVLNSSRKRFLPHSSHSSLSVQFFPFFTCYPANPLGSSFFLVFGFFLLHLAHFSLNFQGRLHAGWLCSVFLLEKEGLCCSNGYSRF
jgi:hypothetical protein